MFGAVAPSRGKGELKEEEEFNHLEGYDENQKLIFVGSIKETVRPQAPEDVEKFVYNLGAVKLSPKQETHMLRLARVLMYSPVAVDTSSTGAGKTLVTINLFSHLNFDTMIVISPNALVQNWNINLSRYGIFFDPTIDAKGKEFYKGSTMDFLNVAGGRVRIFVGEVDNNENYKNTTYDSPYLGARAFNSVGTEQISQEDLRLNQMPYLADPYAAGKNYGERVVKTFFVYEDSGVREALSQRYGDDKTDKVGMYLRGRTVQNYAWLNNSTRRLYVIDEVQKLKNKSLPYWSIVALLNSVFFPSSYEEGGGRRYEGSRSRVLYLSATPFDKLEHVHGFYALNGMTRYAKGVVTFPTGKVGEYLYYSTSVMEILVNILRLVESAAPYHQGTYIRNGKSLLRYNGIGDDELVPLYNGANGVLDLQHAVINVFKEIMGSDRAQMLRAGLADGSYKNIDPTSPFYRGPLIQGAASVKRIGETLFNAYVGFCKYVLCSFVTKPTTSGIERYCSNLFVNVTEKEAKLTLHLAKEYEEYTEKRLALKQKTSAVADGAAQMAFSAQFRRSLNVMKAHAVARIVLDILYHTEGDKIVIFVSENEAETILYNTIRNGLNVRGEPFGCYVANGENQRTNLERLAEFQQHNNNLRVLIAKLTLFSAGQSMHDNSRRGWFPRHTFIIPDPNLTDVSQSIGRTIRVGMTTSAAVYIVYLGQFVPTVDLGEYDISLPYGGFPDNPAAASFIQSLIASGSLPAEFKIELPYGGFYHGEFGEITKVFKNLVSKTLLLRELLLDSDMDFPGDFSSITEHQMVKNGEKFYDWSRNELENKGKDGWSQEEVRQFNYFVRPYARGQSGAMQWVEPGDYPNKSHPDEGFNATVRSIAEKRDIWNNSKKKTGNPPTLPYFAMENSPYRPEKYGDITPEMIRRLNDGIASGNRQQETFSQVVQQGQGNFGQSFGQGQGNFGQGQGNFGQGQGNFGQGQGNFGQGQSFGQRFQ